MLAHLAPEADIPVVQLSINALKAADYHVDLGAKLAALRDRGILILGSGNVVHNLGRIQWDQPDAGLDWAPRFDDAAGELLAGDPSTVLQLADGVTSPVGTGFVRAELDPSLHRVRALVLP